jgi:hypothetical protein
MKTTTRRALVALAFAFLTLGAGRSFAAEPAADSCCCCCEKKAESCCSSGSCKTKRAATNEASERFRAKYGRDLPTAAASAKAATDDCCCKSCC